ncbi:MAG: carotenoid biosynthesis protein, partial [Thermomicrobiales bacterium]
GWKVLNHVPFSIPLSWFYVGFSCYLLASVIVQWLELGSQTAWRLGLGVWFLTVWDLVLDPAMAHHSLKIKFWVWDESGPYFGMPVKNFIGWSITGLIFMALARALWRRDIDAAAFPPLFPLAIYASNMAFAMVLSGGVRLWIPIVLAVVLGLVPAAYALQAKRDNDLHGSPPAPKPSAPPSPAAPTAPSWQPSSISR